MSRIGNLTRLILTRAIYDDYRYIYNVLSSISNGSWEVGKRLLGYPLNTFKHLFCNKAPPRMDQYQGGDKLPLMSEPSCELALHTPVPPTSENLVWPRPTKSSVTAIVVGGRAVRHQQSHAHSFLVYCTVLYRTPL